MTHTAIPLADDNMQQELTAGEAASLLHVPQLYLIGLLDQGIIPFTGEGNRRRIRLCDLMTYKKQRRAQHKKHLDAMLELAQESGVYD